MEIIYGKKLKELTTFRIGGEIDFYTEIESVANLKEALTFAKEKDIPIVVVGGGSNILANDEGFRGLVIKNNISGISFDEDKVGVHVISGAGVDWDELVGETVRKNLFGLENLSLIPGSVGASPIQNIGAYGAEVKQTIEWVEVFDIKAEELKKLSNEECEFAYRHSIFKTEKGKDLIVLRVCFLLQKKGDTFIGYRDLADYFVRRGIARANPKEVRDAVIKIRTKKLPDTNKLGTAGSFFKNPVVSSQEYDALKEKFPMMPGHAEEGAMKVSAAWIIDNLCSMRGVCVGDACVHKNQALVIVNKNSATKKQVDELAQKIINCVHEKTGIKLEREVRSI